ncbi:MAG: flavoredoxin [Gemmataceae bacterium]
MPLPDEALVVRGGMNLPENFARGAGVAAGDGGTLQGVSVNSAPGLDVGALTAPDPQTGYPGILNNQVGVTTVGSVRAAGGDVVPSPTRANPNHATLGGLTPEKASELFRPTVRNPSRAKKTQE